ncbi:uncharacterized protein TM35_000332150 [Trypanosoma theileri]|uniref:Uncharacterized protein n=1 Tax=Trypanosoma theileri TaxID=67003 RepID=A0A1X0NMP7_9TRYP|nr:uncharacterized protein TM35_000332150 [Trypanosoma theileri]ORC85758.1 hypothetical protein TM35_000332150 [Trypanosoma theileri]
MHTAVWRGSAASLLISAVCSPFTPQQQQQQRRFYTLLASPTPIRRFQISDELPLSIPQLRDRLRRQENDNAPRMQTIDTEGRLILTLARSPRTEERIEALQRGELLWKELQEPSSPIPMTSRTGIRLSLCASLRRCALMSKERDLAEKWTERFAQRHNITPEDFTTGPHHTPGEVLGWRKTREKARPGTGIEDEDLEADAEEEEERAENEKEREKKQMHRNKEEKPIQKFRQDVFMDHPMMQQAFKRGVYEPGPRYTGD